MSNNPYAAPTADVRDIAGAQAHQEIRLWSASGRIGRLRYLAYSLGPAFLVGLIAGLLTPVAPTIMPLIVLPVYLAVLVFSILAGIKRSHDMNWTGWTFLLALIPFVGLIWVFNPGTPGENRFGAPPPPNTTGIKLAGIILPILFVVGIVAAIAIPAYQDYVDRAQGLQ